MGINLFEFPVHSADYIVHDNITQVRGNGRREVDSIRTVQKLKGYAVPVAVLTKYNVDILGDTLDFIDSLYLKRVMMDRYNNGRCGTINPASISAAHSQLRKAFTVANQKAKENRGYFIKCMFARLPFKFRELPSNHIRTCSDNILSNPVTLDINGNIRLCNHSTVIVDNIYKQELKDILYSPYANSWNEVILYYCADCSRWSGCRGTSRAASEQSELGLGHVDPVLTDKELQK